MTLRIDFDVSTLTDFVDDMSQDVQAAIRPAAQAGAQLLYQAVLSNVPQSDKGHWFYGTSFKLNGKKYWFDAGSLKRAIYQVFSKDNSSKEISTYHISWNHQKVPYGFMVEYGTARAKAHPFLNKAKSLYPAALEASKDTFFKKITAFK